ncbi:hypothetical protein NHQ30_011500 [Ciborinia camelliae]|nr:hypothetical protein NHQ30_011500 [Ciborinia camelliae]
MKRVPGEPLSTAWKGLSMEEKKSVVTQIVDYIEQLRKFTSDKLVTPDGSPDTVKRGGPFVLSHGDLNAMNIMVKDGRVTAILDWEHGGYLPEWYERWKTRLIELPEYAFFLDEELESRNITISEKGWKFCLAMNEKIHDEEYNRPRAPMYDRLFFWRTNQKYKIWRLDGFSSESAIQDSQARHKAAKAKEDELQATRDRILDLEIKLRDAQEKIKAAEDKVATIASLEALDF